MTNIAVVKSDQVESLAIYSDINQLYKVMLLDYTKRLSKTYKLHTDSADVTNVCKYVQNNLYSKISGEVLEKHLNLTRTYIHNRFKEKTGKNITHYIQEQKNKRS